MKIEKKNYLVKLLTGSLVILNLISCNPNQPQPQPTPAPAPAPTPQPSTVLTKWSIIIDGQTYSWQGYQPGNNSAETSQYTLINANTGYANMTFQKTDLPLQFVFGIHKLGMNTTGSYIINQANSGADNLFTIVGGSNNFNMSTQLGGSVTINITTFPSNSWQANNYSVNGITNDVKVIGNFSGSIGRVNAPSSVAISTISGSFESIRIQ